MLTCTFQKNGSFDLKVIRSYNSSTVDALNPTASEDTIAGLGWTIHFGRVLKSKDTLICANSNAGTSTDNPVLELPDGSKVNCFVLNPVIDDRGMFADRAEARLWITDDARRIPVQIRSKLAFGTVTLRLAQMTFAPAD